ncbi:MAG: hypothetical protein ACRC7C_17020 [Beijerinckiaceae bacterium]
MGQAKLRREAGERISWCRTCTLCCVLPKIAALTKPMYRSCSHLKDKGCSIFGQPARPGACAAYECAYLAARLADSPERNRIPHPLEAGAYFHRDPVEKAVVVFVDPAKPEVWKRSAIPDLIRPALARGDTLVIFDRGRQMTIKTVALLDAVLTRDFVAFAETEGQPLDIATFGEWRAPE